MASDIIRVTDGNILDAPRPSDAGTPHMYARPDLISNNGIPWRQAIQILRKHWKVSVAFALVLEIGLALLVFSLDNTYQGQATIEVEAPSGAGMALSNTGNAPASSVSQQDYIETQTQILQGDALALSVINALHLGDNPVFLKQSWIEKLPARVIGAIVPAKTGPQSQTEVLLETFRRQLSVSQLRSSWLLQVGYESYEPNLSAQVVTEVLRQYLETTHRSKYESTVRAAESLAPELNELKASVERSNRALLDFQRTHAGVELGVSSVAGANGMGVSASPIGVRVAELNQQLTAAIADRLQQESFMQLLERGNGDSLPQLRDDPVIQNLAQRIADVRGQLAQASAVYGENNPQVKKLQMQADELNTQLQSARTQIASRMRSAYTSAQRREELIQKTLRDLKGPLDTSNANASEYDALKREADANSTLYVALSSRIKELAVSGSLNANNIRVVDEARVPQRPAGPRRFRILLMGLMFGLVGGAALAFVAEGMDDTISSLDDLRHWSKIPALALVPQFSRKPMMLSKNRAGSAAMQSVLGIRTKGIPVFVDRPRSAEAESIRNLGTAIRMSSLSDRRVQTVLITSSFPGEGKTTLAVNLAAALSRYGTACLVDADFRHPTITASFGLSLKPGLQDLLLKTHALQEVCTAMPGSPSLCVIGTGMRHSDAVETLTSQRMRDLVDDLRNRFEYIVLDSPPIVPFADARWLSTMSDGAVLVARSSATTRRAMMWSIELLEEVHAPILGVVLNGINLQSEYYCYGVDRNSRSASN